MIPISLTLKGIYSYQEKAQTIEFKHLTDAGIFGIFGSVGSGKSTILEAISYALYGDTERLNRRENRSYNMLNLKSSNLLIDFIFQTGNEHDEYRFTVKGRRNSKKFSDVKSFNREAYKKSNNKWIPISADSAEEIIGLNYLNFRRTVIIPQGKFQDFLQLGDADRTKMMKELFHLQRFDLQYKVAALENENNTKLSNIDGQLIQLVDVSKDRINEIELQIKEKETEFRQNKKQLEGLQKQNEAFEKVQDLFNQISITEKQYEELNSLSKNNKLLEDELNRYNYCVHNFKSLIESSKLLKQKNTNLVAELKDLNNKLISLNEQINKDQESFKNLKPKFDNREKLKTQTEELKKLLNIKEIIIEIETLTERIEKGESKLNETLIKLENLADKKQKNQSKIKQIKSKMPDLAILSDIKHWYTNYHHIENEYALIKKEKEDANKELKGLKTILTDKTAEIFPELKKIDNESITNKIKRKETEIKAQINRLEDNLKHYLIKEKLSEYATNLKLGDACPVCGSTSHPNKLEESDISGKIADLNQTKISLNKELDNLRAFEKKVDEILLKSASLNETIKKLEQKEQENKHKKEMQLALYPLKEKMEEEELEEKFRMANVLQKELQLSENEYADIEKAFTIELRNKEQFSDLLNKLKNEFSAKSTQKETLSGQITQSDIKKGIQTENRELKKQISDLLKQHKEITQQFENLTQRLSLSQNESGKLEGIIQAKNQAFKTNTVELEKTENELQNKIQKSDFESIDLAIELLSKELNVEETAKKIDLFKQQLYSLKEQLSTLKTKAKDKTYNAKAHEKNTQEISKLKELLEDLGKELGSLENNAKTGKKDLQKKQKLEKEQKKLNARTENLSILKSMFKGSGFVNYVSSVYLQNLINAANERFFKLTNQKLQLELTEDNNFEIRDFLNGGKTRSVKTLSGGQTFQASLSLALALADNIQSLSHADHNFFFLDEGFGSLDKESLSVVFSTLKTLRKEKRIVGIISHVEDLQQEVETYLKIENKPETGSLISRSWAY